MPDLNISDDLNNYTPDPAKKRLKITIAYPDTGYIGHMVRYLDEKLTNNDILEKIWCEWNRGSQQESQRFLNAQIRSMMVGDVVSIQAGGITGPSKHYVCEASGWRKLSETQGSAIHDDEDVTKVLL